MKKRSTWIRPDFLKFKKIAFIVVFICLIAAYPLYIASKWVSQFFVIEIEYRPGIELFVDGEIDFELYDNLDDLDSFNGIVIDEINNSKEEIYIAMYSFNMTEVKDALVQAEERGVEVTIIANASRRTEFDEFFRDAKAQFEIIYLPMFKEPDDNYSMHHKFMAVDPQEEDSILLTGSWNWSYLQEDLDPNLLMKIGNKEIIETYMDEIERLKRGNSGYGKFRDLLYIPWANVVEYSSGEKIEIWFSPGRRENSMETRIVDLVESSEETIDIGLTIFDSHTVAKRLLDKAKEGVRVRVIVNAASLAGDDSIIPWLRTKVEEYELETMEIYEGGTLPTAEIPEYSIFHHNYLIIDNRVVLTGTANWTYGGFFFNDENTLIFYSEDIAQQFTDKFTKYLEHGIISSD